MDITVSKIGNRAFLRLDEVSTEIKDYKISSPMHGRTELEVVFEFNGGTAEFFTKAEGGPGVQAEDQPCPQQLIANVVAQQIQNSLLHE